MKRKCSGAYREGGVEGEGGATDTPFMDTVSFHGKIKSPFPYNFKMNVVTFEKKSNNKILNSKLTQTKYHCKYVWTNNKKLKRKTVIINSLYIIRIFSSLKNCSE